MARKRLLPQVKGKQTRMPASHCPRTELVKHVTQQEEVCLELEQAGEVAETHVPWRLTCWKDEAPTQSMHQASEMFGQRGKTF